MAKDKGNYPGIYDELFALRKSVEALSPERMAGFPALTARLGGGDPWLAVGALRDDLAAALDSEDRETQAFAASFHGSGSVIKRLEVVAGRLSVEYRRARDLSDAGLLKFSERIGSKTLLIQPSISLVVFVYQDYVAIIPTLVIPVTSIVQSQLPTFWLDNEVIDLKYEREEIERGLSFTFDRVKRDIPDEPGMFLHFGLFRTGGHDSVVGTQVQSGRGDIVIQSGTHKTGVIVTATRLMPDEA